jgi:hypothetical protein
MADEAIIEAEYVEWKMVKTRSALQLVFEVPLERQEHVMRALGVPLPDKSNPVAIARLLPAAQRSNVVQIEDHRHPEDEPTRAPMTLAQSAGFLCGTPTFQQFIYENSEGWDHRPTKDEAAEWLRSICGVASRADIKPENHVAAERFRKVRADYNAWMLVA